MLSAVAQERACFIDRTRCIACDGAELETLSQGRYADEPLRGIIASQAWGEHPLPFIEHERWHYVRCRDCGQRFQQRILDPTWMHRLYTRWETQQAMADFTAATSTPADRARRGMHFMIHALRLHRLLPQQPAPRVLDYGCGHGEFVAVCRTLGLDAHGIDWAVDRREHGLVHIHPSLDALRGSAAFDAVTLFEVLEHLAEPRQALEALTALLKPGALLVLETPDTTAVTDLRSFNDYLAIAPLGHINGFTPDSLRAIAERVGFRAIVPPPVWVADSWRDAAKSCVRNLIARWRKPTTSQLFVLDRP
jgi:2-polyprenyl-3-methyl-5-hydroxy-6-metoxy-1,4-benzoquinol methylase